MLQLLSMLEKPSSKSAIDSRDPFIVAAKHRVMDLIAVRDHSEQELRTKLRKHFERNSKRRSGNRKGSAFEGPFDENDGVGFGETPSSEDDVLEGVSNASGLSSRIEEAIEAAIQFAKDRGWLGEPHELSEKLADRFHEKKKGIEYINAVLEARGLPPVPQESELELEKALSLVKNRYSDFSNLSPEEQDKVRVRAARLLASRGFSSEIVRKVIYEKLGH